MALHEKQERNTVYLDIKHHCLCQISKTPQEGYREIKTVNPKTKAEVIKYIHPYDGVDGFITSIEWYDRTDNQDNRYVGYNVKLDSDGQPVVINIAYRTRAFDTLLKCAENIDFTQRVHFSAWHDRKDDATAFCIRQGNRTGSVIKRRYTKENPGNMPPAKQGLTGWDFSEQQIWLKKNFDEVVLPAVAAAVAGREQEVTREEVATVLGATKAKAVGASNDSFGDLPPENYEDSIPF